MTTRNRGLLLWLRLAILMLLPFEATGLTAAESDQQSADPTPATGRLDIQGEAIESLTLARRIGRSDAYDSSDPLVLQHPGSSVSIPVGDYLLLQINLAGGFRCNVPFHIIDGRTDKVEKGPEWLTISPDKPCTLKAGAPLKLEPRVSRLGRVIYLLYKLLDAEGRRYDASTTPRPLPQFAIYQGDREIASGDSMSLEYG